MTKISSCPGLYLLPSTQSFLISAGIRSREGVVAVGNVLANLLKLLDAVLLTPLTTEPQFRTGFLTACWFFLAGGLGLRLISRWLAPITAFFKPTKSPATKDGPTPFSLLIGCLIPVIVTLVIFFSILWFGFLRP